MALLRARSGCVARRPTGTAAERLAGKFGMSLERALQLHAEMDERAAGDGLEYHLDQTKGGNSFDAHRLIHLAATYGHQAAAKERLMRAYFTEGESLGERDTLVRLMDEVGVDPVEARESLRLDSFAEDVREDERSAAQLGIQGVPFFVLRPSLRPLRRAAGGDHAHRARARVGRGG